ncbi:uncharacterized protein N7496_011406 [Penicillium cataractarum]|uniref:DASH complex subunit ASK1 n=1 Tax=Penicillium cataractarum TaxID=2100454 RepID=A0A9W9RK34_9EURO|nr:uncharacterized protein N7496_011406 [Penicillium cataractarum]KAJ5358993.1 hypothetical protein N7496_011406 [Penicillium cataractarum]
MSHQSAQSQRPLTLTEELEKLEQSITLTLQEIDHNFSQAHRIVTTSILPLVEQYTEHSRDVWEGAKFWKQFFEASANVSLSGYEERPDGDETVQDTTATEEELSADVTQSTSVDETDQSYETPSSRRHDHNTGHGHDIDLTELTISSHSTPRATGQPTDEDMTISSIDRSSSYENLRKQINEADAPFDMPDSSKLPSTPGRQPFFPPDASVTPMSSPFIPPVSSTKYAPASHGDSQYQKPSDPVLHHVLDKTYRVQATPLGKGYRNVGYGASTQSKFTVTPKAAASTSRYAFDDSPLSSPELEAPRLHSEIFSPIKGVTETPGTNRKRRTSSNRLRETPKPGTSVLTPAKKYGGHQSVWDSDDDLDDEDFGPSPPKTMHFHIPQSRLMKTPAKEASKRIVTDLLATAGAGDLTEELDDDQSPSVIRRTERLEDDTF